MPLAAQMFAAPGDPRTTRAAQPNPAYHRNP